MIAGRWWCTSHRSRVSRAMLFARARRCRFRLSRWTGRCSGRCGRRAGWRRIWTSVISRYSTYRSAAFAFPIRPKRRKTRSPRFSNASFPSSIWRSRWTACWRTWLNSRIDGRPSRNLNNDPPVIVFRNSPTILVLDRRRPDPRADREFGSPAAWPTRPFTLIRSAGDDRYFLLRG